MEMIVFTVLVASTILGLSLMVIGMEKDAFQEFVGIALVVCSIVGFYLFSANETTAYYNNINQMIASGTEVYLDGQLVDGTKVDLKYYHVTIEDDCILLSHKE